jgi:hypothetical protein
MPLPITLTADELQSITGYRTPTRQLEVLRERGFCRAYIGRHGVVLERAHYDAVCRGEFGHVQPRKSANLDFLRAPKTA